MLRSAVSDYIDRIVEGRSLRQRVITQPRPKDGVNPETLQGLTKFLWQGHAHFDAETDHLMLTPNMAAAMTFHHPPSVDKSKLPKFTAGPPGPAPSLVAAPKPRPKRAG